MAPTSETIPELTIGLPVYNGERFLEQAILSLLNQTFSDFELVISDNGSDDGTESICRQAAQADKRIRYIRHPHNRGAIFNWNFVAGEARGRYFKWASANDYCDPRFLEACRDELENNPDVVLCYTRTHLIQGDPSRSELDTHDIEALESKAGERFLRMMGHPGRNNAIQGVMRTQTLARTRLNRPYPHGDKVLMAELAAYGRFRCLDEPLFYRRFDDTSSSVRAHSKRQLSLFLAPERKWLAPLALWSRQLGFFFASLRVPIPLGERAALAVSVSRRIWWTRIALWRELCEYFQRSGRQPSE